MSSKNHSFRTMLEVAWALIPTFLIIVIGPTLWGVLLSINLNANPAVPWSVPVMAVVLWLSWQYLNGKGGPRSTSDERHIRLRASRVPWKVFIWALLSGVLSIVALTGYWIVMFNLVAMPGNVLPDISKSSPIVIIPVLIIAILVSPLSEEAAFRGYFQVVLERNFAAPAAILISSLFFALEHLTQGFWLPKLFVYYLGGVGFGITAYLTKSILPGIAVHILADLTFFTTVWPFDSTRRLVWQSGPDALFWIHAGQAIVFTILAVLAYRQLYLVTKLERLRL
jgi:membrane protease YdiL (CAAX protease family)